MYPVTSSFAAGRLTGTSHCRPPSSPGCSQRGSHFPLAPRPQRRDRSQVAQPASDPGKSTPSFASTPAVRRKMQRQRRRDTPIELALRAELFRRGLRYFVHRRPLPAFRREADIVFPGARVAVFVDSCWWHACPEHGSIPRVNRDWWAAKLSNNQLRDRDTNARLEAEGWKVVRVWEHEAPAEAAARVEQTVAEARRTATTSGGDRRAPHRERLRATGGQRSRSGGAD